MMTLQFTKMNELESFLKFLELFLNREKYNYGGVLAVHAFFYKCISNSTLNTYAAVQLY